MLEKVRFNYLSKFLPTFSLQKLKVGEAYICSLNDQSGRAGNIFTRIACGADFSWYKAVMKAQSEYVERKAYQSSTANSSTGFAAYPFIFQKAKAQRKAKSIAYREMLERYAWPEWFENKDIAYKVREAVNEENKSFFQGIDKEFCFSSFYAIWPKLADKNVKLVIFYAQIEEGLVCAAAANEHEVQAEQGALKELYMHAIGLYRMRSHKIHPSTPYEKRVDWIGGQREALEKRLAFSGDQPISVPFPVVFQSIKTEFSQAYVVERCMFEGYDKKFISEDNEMYI
ncbi:MAG: hypothetical protein ABFQ95_00105 [Pseudomonadota bacterium]